MVDDKKTCDGSGAGCRLLDAAEELFAEKGFAATSVREITDQAQCNIAAVNYHYGGKENLYRAVYERLFAGLRQQRLDGIEQSLGDRGEAMSLEDFLKAFADVFMEPFRDGIAGRRMVQLMSREMMSPRLPKGMFAAEIAPVRVRLAEVLCSLCPGLSVDKVQWCIVSLVAQLIHLHHIMEWDGSALSSAGVDWSGVSEHVARFTAAGIRSYVEDEQSTE